MLYQIQQLLAMDIKTAFHPYNVIKWMIIVSYKQSLYFFLVCGKIGSWQKVRKYKVGKI
jgi:hypothetical protein